MSHNIFGDLSTLHGQFKNLKSTIQAQKALKVTNEWCNEYARRNGWGPPSLDFIAATRKGTWQGAPTAEPATRVDMGTSMAVRADDGTFLLEIADAILWRAKMTGVGLAKHPTWVGESLSVAALVDTRAGGLAPFSAVCQSILPPVQSLLKSAFGKPGVYLGKTREVRIGDELPVIDDFRLYSAAPDRLDRKIHERLTAALDGWTGHLRLQTFDTVGVFLAWNWRGDDRKGWSADADRVINVLQRVRDAFLGPQAGPSAKAAAVKAPVQASAQPKSSRPSVRSQSSSGAPVTSRATKPKGTQVPKNSAGPPDSQRRPDTDGAERIRLRYSVSNKSHQNSGESSTYQEQMFRLPSGMSARVQKWLVRPGDAMIKDQPIVRVTVTGDDGRQREVLLTAPVSGCHITRRRDVGTGLTGRSIVAHVSGTPN
jgi:hypothetical protein